MKRMLLILVGAVLLVTGLNNTVFWRQAVKELRTLSNSAAPSDQDSKLQYPRLMKAMTILKVDLFTPAEEQQVDPAELAMTITRGIQLRTVFWVMVGALGIALLFFGWMRPQTGRPVQGPPRS